MQTVISLVKPAIAPLLIAFIISLQVPAQIYWGNSEEFMLSLGALAPILWAVFATIASILLLPALLPTKKFRLRYSSFLQMLALLVWFTASFRFGDYGAFDGRGIDIEPLSASALLELGVWGLLLCLALLFCKRLAPLMFPWVCGILVLNCALLGFQTLQQGPSFTKQGKPKADNAANFHPQLLEFSSRKNVVHIVLDELQTSITTSLLDKDPELASTLDGFVFYPDTAANYPTTYMGLVAMLTGKIYRNETDKEAFIDAAMHGKSLANVLQQGGFRVDHHTIPTHCEGTRLPHCSPIRAGLPGAVALSLIDFGFFRAAPEFLKAAIHNDDSWFVTHLFYGGRYPATLAGRAHLLFEEFNRKLRVAKGAPPTYKFFHSMLTHQPLTLTATCGIRSTTAELTLPNRRAQAQCAFEHVKNFLEKLKALRIYDQTMVIVSSDHGSTFHVDTEVDKLIQTGIPPVHHSRALATLLVKPFNARGVLQTSMLPAQLSDVPNTVLAELDMSLLENGEDIAALPQDAQRQREYTHFAWDYQVRSLPYLQDKLSYVIHGDVRKAESWQPADYADYVALSPGQVLQCGETVKFSDRKLADRLATAGLDKAESWGRWTTGGRAILYFRFDAKNCQASRLEIRANAENPAISALLHLNGKPLGKLAFTNREKTSSRPKLGVRSIPRQLLREDAPNMLEIEIAGADSPRHLDLDPQDDRLLGLALVSLTIEADDAGALSQR